MAASRKRKKRKSRKSGAGRGLRWLVLLLAMAALLLSLRTLGVFRTWPGRPSGGTQPASTATAATTTAHSSNSSQSTSQPTLPDESRPAASPRVPGVPDPTALMKLDNKLLSWWIRLNGEHKTPEVPPDIQDILRGSQGFYVGDTGISRVYLTFDEGYENGYTGKILDVLRDNEVKAMFFITSGYLKNSPDLVQRMVQEGHEVGNHSVSHLSMPSLTDPAKFTSEIEGLTRDFKEKFGSDMLYFRPPMGEYSVRSLAATWQLGYKTVFWSFAYDDWYVDRQRGADYAYDICMRNIHKGAIYLLHAVSKDNADALDRIIKGIRAQGYEIGDPREIGNRPATGN